MERPFGYPIISDATSTFRRSATRRDLRRETSPDSKQEVHCGRASSLSFQSPLPLGGLTLLHVSHRDRDRRQFRRAATSYPKSFFGIMTPAKSSSHRTCSGS